MQQFISSVPTDGVRVARLAISPTSTAAAGAFSWINPLKRDILFSVTLSFDTAGTGTIDVGISDDGTGASAVILDGGTLTGQVTAVRGAGTAGGTSVFRLQGAGGTNNSVVAQHSDTPTSTMVGTAIIRYWPAV